MPNIPKIPETVEEYQTIVEYLQSGTLPADVQKNPTIKFNFIRRCKILEVDENNVLYTKLVVKNSVIKSGKRRIVPKYDVEMLILILERFHDQANHREYHKTFSAISEKHIGITQNEVRAYVNETTTVQTAAAVEQHISRMLEIRESINASLGKYCVFKSLTSNNQTAIVEMDGEDVRVPVK
ncbi:1942_t:CDS:2 [Cetraspora pellucida]|uniref:1942_t:CDS:1 n=1 Tax=Cetraspora pellucida TaxID=1433469 RepID=A0ACA9LTL3_9GLOM|nr:1942_t:CDS:2 [Cetraspora pellucida]